MSDDERMLLVNHIAANPLAGVELGGGLRKIRIARRGAGKSGGFRTIYVYAGQHIPLFLMTVYGKNEKANLSTKELATSVALSKAIVASYGDE